MRRTSTSMLKVLLWTEEANLGIRDMVGRSKKGDCLASIRILDDISSNPIPFNGNFPIDTINEWYSRLEGSDKITDIWGQPA
eukprot:7800453-Ditylum_brightwellii.AAC.1